MPTTEPIKSGWMWRRHESGALSLARVLDSNRTSSRLADGTIFVREPKVRMGPDGDGLPGRILGPPDIPPNHPLWARIEIHTATGATFVFGPEDLLQLQQIVKEPFQKGSAVLAGLRGASATYEEINLGALAFMDLHITSPLGTISFGVGQPEQWCFLRSFSLTEWAHVRANGGHLVPMVQNRPKAMPEPEAATILHEIAEAELYKYGVPPKRDGLLSMAATKTGWGTDRLRTLYKRLPPHLRNRSRDKKYW